MVCFRKNCLIRYTQPIRKTNGCKYEEFCEGKLDVDLTIGQNENSVNDATEASNQKGISESEVQHYADM